MAPLLLHLRGRNVFLLSDQQLHALVKETEKAPTLHLVAQCFQLAIKMSDWDQNLIALFDGGVDEWSFALLSD